MLGLREALRPDGTPSGEIGMTCWLCHGQQRPAAKSPVLGLPGTAFDYGLLLATAAVLDDANAEAARYRRARGFPSGRTVRARLLLAGPGRQDLTGEFGLDVTVPGYHSARYAGTARVRQGTRGIVNPISVPGILAAPGLALENWSGSEDADGAVAGTPDRARRAGPRRDVSQAFGLPGDDRGAARRALLFDLRNLGTLGLQHDSFPGLLWADAIYGHAGAVSRRDLPAIPPMYAAVRRARDGRRSRPSWRSAARRPRRRRGRQRGARALDLRRTDRRNDRQPPDLQARRRARTRRAKIEGRCWRRSIATKRARREAGRAVRRLPFGGAAGDGPPAGRQPAAAGAVHALPCRAREAG